MAIILDILRERARERQRPEERRLTTAIVVRPEGAQYRVSDGANSFLAYSSGGDPLQEGDRVFLLRDGENAVILGLQGRDKDFPTP